MVFSGGNKNNRIQMMLQQLREAEIPENAVRFIGYVDDADLPGRLFQLIRGQLVKGQLHQTDAALQQGLAGQPRKGDV